MLLGGGKKGMCYVAFFFNVLQLLMGGDVIYNKNSVGFVEGIRDRDRLRSTMSH